MKNNITNAITALFVIPAILFICIACGFMSYYAFDQKIQTLTLSIDNLSEYIYSTYIDQLNGMETLSQLPGIINFIDDPSNPEYRAMASSDLFNQVNVNDTFSEVILFDPQGNILLSSKPDSSPVTPDNQEVINTVRETNARYVNLDFEDNIPILLIGYPILKNNQLIAIYKRETPLNYLSYYAQNVNSDDENIYIVSENKGIVYEKRDVEPYYNIRKFDNTNEPFQELTTIESNIEESKQRDADPIINFENDNKDIIGAYTFVDDIGWMLLITQPRALIFYSINLFQIIMIIISLIIAVVMYFIIRNFTKNLIDPMENYNKDIEDFLKGDRQRRVDTNEISFIADLGENINKLEEEIERDRIEKRTSQQKLDYLVNYDSITGLKNNKALYEIIDKEFGNSSNQAIIALDTGIYKELSENFGNSVTNRMLEVVTEIIKDFSTENTTLARVSQDNFIIFLKDFKDQFSVTEKVQEILLRLKSLTHIDDLQVKLNPHVAVIFRDKHILGRSDWLRLSVVQLKRANIENKDLVVFDFTTLEEINQEKPELFENLLFTNNLAIEGFSKSNKRYVAPDEIKED